MKNVVVWFDIPVANLERAVKFYSKVLAVEIQKMEGAPKKYAMFPFEPGLASGGLVEDKNLITENGPPALLERRRRPVYSTRARGGCWR